jgi:hypothetical protein
MRAPADGELLRIWELGQDESPARRALRLLAAADPAAGERGAEQLSVGRRDADLLRLRAATFGPTLDCRIHCTRCDEPLEFPLQVADLISGASGAASELVRFQLEDWEVSARPPTAGDLATLGGQDTGDDLLLRCVIEASRDGSPADVRDAGPELAAALDRRLVEADPWSQIELDLTCPACGHSWSQGFDILAFYWSEIEAWARRTLLEVHALASAYGWTESEVLRLGARRRQLYLELAVT